jgi:hypothetical protein
MNDFLLKRKDCIGQPELRSGSARPECFVLKSLECIGSADAQRQAAGLLSPNNVSSF